MFRSSRKPASGKMGGNISIIYLLRSLGVTKAGLPNRLLSYLGSSRPSLTLGCLQSLSLDQLLTPA